MICSGASLIQLDAASLTYAGPAIVFNIHKGLVKLLSEKGFSKIEQAIGCDLRAQVDLTTPAVAPSASMPVSSAPNHPFPGQNNQ